ncbi:hypothetical protein FRC03_005977 [Tulasnella sp. 419]|nr:hypothetical protein FRC02_011573 [Tulasnella sp. 418]KAG8968797.1 hypothetical protein FRC03_005977 [Tulasnella sp. 419]
MSYVIAGRAIKNEYLALGTLLSVGALSWGLTSGSSSKPKAPPKSEPIKVPGASGEEEDFIKAFVAEAEKAEAGGKH